MNMSMLTFIVCAESNVKDCFEKEDDCIKDLEQPINEIESSDRITEESHEIYFSNFRILLK